MSLLRIKDGNNNLITIPTHAMEMPILDLPEYYESENVEGALREIGAKIVNGVATPDEIEALVRQIEILQNNIRTIVTEQVKEQLKDFNPSVSIDRAEVEAIVDEKLANIDLAGLTGLDIQTLEIIIQAYKDGTLGGGIDEQQFYELLSSQLNVPVLNILTEAYLNGDLSGGGSGAVSPTIESEFAKETVIEEGQDVKIDIYFQTPNLGEGTAYITINGIEIDYYPTLKQGDNIIKIENKYITKTANTISIYVKDRMQMTSNKLTFKVISGGVSLTTTFDYTVDYVVGQNILFPFYTTTELSGEITLEVVIDGVPLEPMVCANGYNSFYLNRYITGVGVHAIRMQAFVGEYHSKVLNFNVVISSSTQLILSTDLLEGSQFEYGNPIQMAYRISKLGSEVFRVEFYIDDILKRTSNVQTGNYFWTISGTEMNIGRHKLDIIAYGMNDDRASVSVNIEIVAGEFTPIEVVSQGMVCFLDSDGYSNEQQNKEIWLDKSGHGNNGELIDFNFSTNGWSPVVAEVDEEGNEVMVKHNGLVCNNEAYVRIPYKPFLENVINGYTMEIVYTPEHSGNDLARVLEYVDHDSPYTGVFVDINEANIKSESETSMGTVDLDYESGEIQLDFVIDRENKMCRMYVNGIVSRYWMLSDSGTKRENFAIDTDYIYINFSGLNEEYCGGTNVVRKFICYERALSHEEVVQNLIANQPDLASMQKMYKWNYETQIPKLYIYGDISKCSTTNPSYVRVRFESPDTNLYGDSFDMESSNTPFYLQGTSSLGYSRKNYRFVLMDSNGKEFFHALSPNIIPESTFTLKCDYVDSSMTSNVCLAQIANDAVYGKGFTPAQKDNADRRTAIYGHAIELINVVDNEQESLGAYMFNIDRYATKNMGYDIKQYPNMLCIEGESNSDVGSSAFFSYSNPQSSGNQFPNEVAYHNEGWRVVYPSINEDAWNFAPVKRLVDFVSDASDDDFKDSFEQYFNKDSILRYYLFDMFIGGIDGLSKNFHLCSWDGQIFYCLPYDLDSCLGGTNTGYLRVPASCEVGTLYDTDGVTILEENHFNSWNSRLWARVRSTFSVDLNNMYTTLRSNGLFTLENMLSYFERVWEVIPPKMYNESQQIKYINDGAVGMVALHGNRKLQIKKWLRERIAYLDSKFGYYAGGGTNEQYVNFRMNYQGAVSLDISTYYTVYAKVRWASKNEQVIRIAKGQKKTFSYYSDVGTDREVMIMLPESLKTIENISNIHPNSIDISKATKLTQIEAHNPNLFSVDLSKNKYLRKVDFNGCEKLGTETATMTLNYCKYLNYVDLRETKITAVTFNTKGGSLRKIYYPTTIQSINLINQGLLTDMILPYGEDGSKAPIDLATINIENCPNVSKLIDLTSDPTSLSGMKYCRNLTLNNSIKLTRFNFYGFTRLANVNLQNMDSLEEVDFLNMTEVGQTSNLRYIGISACPSMTSISMNVDDPNYEITWANEGVLDLQTSGAVREITSNCIIKGLETIILPKTIESLYFTTEYGTGYSDVKNIWSAEACTVSKTGVFPVAYHLNSEDTVDEYVGIDFRGLHLLNIDLGALVNIPEAINFTLYPTDVNPNFNLHRDGTSLPYLQPVGTLDLTNYTGSLAKFFNGVDLDVLEVICNTILPQTDYSYCLYNAKFSSLTNVEKFLKKVGYISNASYMFAETIINNIDIMEQVVLGKNAILDYMFSGTKVTNIDNLTLPTNIKSAKGFVSRCRNLTSASNVTLTINGAVSHFFDGCTNLINISGLTIKNVTAIDYILNDCFKISADLRSWDLSKCDEMSYALAGTQIENNIDLSNLKLGSSNCKYNGLFGENLDNISINLSNSQVNANAIETIVEGITNVSLNLTGVDLSKRTDFDGWFENCDLIEIILDNVTWSDKGIHFNRAFKNTRISKDFLLPITTTRAEECFSSIPTLTHIHSNWEQKYKDYVVTNEWGEVLSRETLIPTNCYAGNSAITHYDDIDIGVSEFLHGLDQIPMEWGGNGFTKGMAGIYVFTIPSDNYTINFGSIASRANFVTQQGIVSWGDGSPIQTYKDFESSGSVTHTYTNAGRYVVKGHLHFSSGYSNNTKSCLTIVAAVPNGQPSNTGGGLMTSSFGGCNNLVSANVAGLINKRHSGLLNIQMFNGCSSLTQITGLETWDVSNITTLSWTFYNIANIKSITGLKNWNVSKLEKLDITFSGCKQLRQLDIDSWNTSNLKALPNTFGNCPNLDLSILRDWNVSNVEYLNGAFSGNLGTDFSWLENWNIGSKLKDITNMINNAINVESLDLSRWNCPNIKNMASAFYNCKKLKTLNISGIGNIGMIEEPEDNSSTLSSFFGYCIVLEDMILGDNFTISSAKQLNGRYLFASATALTTETLVSILNHLADRTGKTTDNLYFPTQLITKLSADQMSIATNKNWTIVQV